MPLKYLWKPLPWNPPFELADMMAISGSFSWLGIGCLHFWNM
jgi:hypothetical protein